MLKTIAMLLSLAFVAGAGIACFGLFGDKEKPASACEGLEGQAKIDCEKRQNP